MPADFLSRSNNTLVVNAIQLTARDLADQQGKDPEIQALKEFQATRKWTSFLPPYRRHAMQKLEPNFTTDIPRRFWVKTTHKGLTRNLLYAPAYLRKDLLHEAHGNILAGHSAIERTMDHIKTSWWWPSLKLDVTSHIRRCTGCQKTKKSNTKPAPLAPLPIPDGPNIRMHADLFGLLKSNSGNKYIQCMTDAFTKIAVVVQIPDKEATTVASNILHHWIYRNKSIPTVANNFATNCPTNYGRSGTLKEQNQRWRIPSATPKERISTNASKNIWRPTSMMIPWIGKNSCQP